MNGNMRTELFKLFIQQQLVDLYQNVYAVTKAGAMTLMQQENRTREDAERIMLEVEEEARIIVKKRAIEFEISQQEGES